MHDTYRERHRHWRHDELHLSKILPMVSNNSTQDRSGTHSPAGHTAGAAMSCMHLFTMVGTAIGFDSSADYRFENLRHFLRGEVMAEET